MVANLHIIFRISGGRFGKSVKACNGAVWSGMFSGGKVDRMAFRRDILRWEIRRDRSNLVDATLLSRNGVEEENCRDENDTWEAFIDLI
jgi:hypothetical protein